MNGDNANFTSTNVTLVKFIFNDFYQHSLSRMNNTEIAISIYLTFIINYGKILKVLYTENKIKCSQL